MNNKKNEIFIFELKETIIFLFNFIIDYLVNGRVSILLKYILI